MWLEDLFVRPAHRGEGSAGRCWRRSRRACASAAGERLEWSALDWNELALGFYRGLGAQTMDEWITHRLVGEELSGSPPRPRRARRRRAVRRR